MREGRENGGVRVGFLVFVWKRYLMFLFKILLVKVSRYMVIFEIN